jgi:purine-binding chemotaxis protein CheW
MANNDSKSSRGHNLETRSSRAPGSKTAKPQVIEELPISVKMPGKRAQAMSMGPLKEYLAFRLADEIYALPLADIREILTPPVLTIVPRAPANVLGIISVRGTLVTVFDLRMKLRMQRFARTKRTRILLVPSPTGELLGLYVDEVLQVYRLVDAEIEVAVNVLGGNLADYVVGIGRYEGTIVIILSLAQLLADTS